MSSPSHLVDGRLSSRATMYSRWLDGRYTPLARQHLASTFDVPYSRSDLRAETPRADEPKPAATEIPPCSPMESSTDKQLNPAPLPVRLDPQACFTLIVGQVASLFDAAQAPQADEAALASEATPLQPATAADPTAWSTRRKWVFTLLVGFTMFNGSFASTAPNGAGVHMVQQFGLSNEEMVFIATSFVGGCVAGPIIWAPLSEIHGRRLVFLISTLLYSLTNIGCALAPTKSVLFTCRFLAGICASSAFSNAAAVITDLFAPPDRSGPMIVASLAPLLGPCFGPLFGAGVSLNLRWPFVFWLLGAIGLALEAVLFCVPETYAPVIAARTKPKETVPAHVTSWRQKTRTFFLVNLGRPINMMCREPIVMCATFYLSFFFALMYIFFASWPLIFGPPGIYRLDAIHTGITFLPMGVGGALAAVWLAMCDRPRIRARRPANGPVPEAKLIPTFLVAPLVAAGLLWAGWLSRASVPYQVTMLAGIPIGAAMVLCFQGWIGFLGDCYRLYSSSAIAATVIGRSISGATIPLCTHRLHEKLGGIAILYTVLAGLVVLTIPMPFLVFRFGAKLRARSMYKPGRG
ncbi:related to TPO3-Polyamine transport protein [Sporisorium reilianum f. sp. reilianum]|uniref:Related to TPO3-Polyamine transport protein n=1 Tax=Sporisorium reilianum f. sp. reilianum TaxID=72559 RepID=A0A2N8UL20_9BASI|nr:related to TPO3-Polyamine transport protein [Sporisorium reilianum f. sp. reilianum]